MRRNLHSQWTLGFGSVSGGVILAVAVPLFVEYSRFPALRIERAQDVNYGDGNKGSRIVHVKVINSPFTGWRARWLLRNDATGCTITFRFRSRSDEAETKVIGRWSSTPEPLTPMPDGHLTFDITKMPQSQRLDVSPGGDGEMVGVAIKHVGEEAAYAFGRGLAVAVGAAHAGADRGDMILLLG